MPTTSTTSTTPITKHKLGRPRGCYCGTCQACKACTRAKDYWNNLSDEKKREILDRRTQNRGEKINADARRRVKLRYTPAPEKQAARRQLQHAVNTGQLTRLPCEVCGDPTSQGHHEDYTKPLDVNWLCSKHHGERHRKYVSSPTSNTTS